MVFVRAGGVRVAVPGREHDVRNSGWVGSVFTRGAPSSRSVLPVLPGSTSSVFLEVPFAQICWVAWVVAGLHPRRSFASASRLCPIWNGWFWNSSSLLTFPSRGVGSSRVVRCAVDGPGGAVFMGRSTQSPWWWGMERSPTGEVDGRVHRSPIPSFLHSTPFPWSPRGVRLDRIGWSFPFSTGLSVPDPTDRSEVRARGLVDPTLIDHTDRNAHHPRNPWRMHRSMGSERT